MKTTARKAALEHMVRLADIISATPGGTVTAGSLEALEVDLPGLAGPCVQVVLFWDRDSLMTPYGQHRHAVTQHIIMVKGLMDVYLVGTDDCHRLASPHCYTIKPGQLHDAILHPGAMGIMVMIPPDPDYRRTAAGD